MARRGIWVSSEESDEAEHDSGNSEQACDNSAQAEKDVPCDASTMRRLPPLTRLLAITGIKKKPPSCRTCRKPVAGLGEFAAEFDESQRHDSWPPGHFAATLSVLAGFFGSAGGFLV